MFPCEMARCIAGFQPEARKYGRIFGLPALRLRPVWARSRGSGPLTISTGHRARTSWPPPPAPGVAEARPSGAAEQPFGVAEQPSGAEVVQPSSVAATGRPSSAAARPSSAVARPSSAVEMAERPGPPVVEALPLVPRPAAARAEVQAAIEVSAQSQRTASAAQRRWVAALRPAGPPELWPRWRAWSR